MLDLVIRNGTIVDGTGLPAYAGDLGVHDGRIASVGRRLGDVEAAVSIDAAGLVVAPGFVDPHTHYDAQLLFDPYAFPAIEHGITSVVTGNCSLSMAPVRPAHRERFSRMFRLIEEMPEAAFDVGVDWRWGDAFGAMIDTLSGDTALNVAPLVGHSVLRMYVLGDEPRRPATTGEVATMCGLLRDCLDAGAVGLSTSYVDVEDDLQPVPCRWAEHAELEALCGVLAERGRMLQIVHEFFDPGLTVSRIEMLADLSLRYGIPTTFSPLFHSAATPEGAAQVMTAVERVWAAGARVWPQVQTRPIDISWTMAQRSIMFLAIPGWWSVLSMGDRAAKLEALSDPAKQAVLTAGLDAVAAIAGPAMDPASYVVRGVVEERNRELVGRTLGEIAAERGTTAAQLLIDLSIDEQLGTWFQRAGIGHSDGPAVGGLLAHPLVHVGASDGGAHVGSFATYGDTGFLFSRYVRELGALSLEAAVKKITADPCSIWGLPGRGELKEGFAADVVVFDPATIDRGPEVASDDFPGGGRRWIRRSEGVDTVVVNGVVTWTATGGYAPEARAGVVASQR
ncbi:MAG: N-acyl-D-amino-acid deacylase family protein [Ilumatobacteraceae bacterium]